MNTICTSRIGLLICGSLTGPVEAAHGSYLDVYTHYLKSTIPHNFDAQLSLDDYDIKKLDFPNERQISETDMLIVTGSGVLLLSLLNT
jgi:hypothetical protein